MASSDHSSSTQIVQELEELSESMYKSHTRRTASLALPRTAIPPISAPDDDDHPSLGKDALNLINPANKPRSRRMSLSPWRSRPKPDAAADEPAVAESKSKFSDEPPSAAKKGGIWNWKPIRALSHIGMMKLSCLFSVEVVAIQGVPASMNGLRLLVCVRKKETKDGAVQTMPSRVSNGAADFEETLFIRCHVYFTPGSGGGAHAKFEPRPFLIYVVAVDAEELEFGRNAVDLSSLIQQSVEKSFEGTRVRQWDTTYKLSGKAKGGQLLLKLGIQIMEKDGGIGIYTQAEGSQKSSKSRTFSPSIARKQSKSSFSVSSPRMSTPTQKTEMDLQGIDELNLDEPSKAPPPPRALPKPEEDEPKAVDDADFPDFDVVEKGVEIQDKERDEEDEEEERSEENSDMRSASSEVVKEIVQDQSHVMRMTELDSIAQQIKALESIMGKEDEESKNDTNSASQILDAEEDKVTREFLQMLEGVETEDHDIDDDDDIMPHLKLERFDSTQEAESEVYLPDLGKGLGCVVQTRNGGYLAAMNPLDNVVSRKDTPKLAMQMSKPVIMRSSKAAGFELFQKMAAIGVEELTSEIFSLMPMDELSGKTAEQIAFEGIASAIIQGRSKERASSSAARTIAAVKTMGTAMSSGRKERISTGIWNVGEEPLSIDDVLAFSMQKIESMAVDALRIQADISEEEAPFDVSPLDAKTTVGGKVYNHPLAFATPVEDWIKVNNNTRGASNNAAAAGVENITVSVVIQLRDPLRQYEVVGGPMIALIQATSVSDQYYDEEMRYKVASLQVGGIKTNASGSKNVWSSEKQRLTALQWLVSYGIAKAGKKGNPPGASKGPDILWSVSSRVMADMWLKQIRNPDVKFSKLP